MSREVSRSRIVRSFRRPVARLENAFARLERAYLERIAPATSCICVDREGRKLEDEQVREALRHGEASTCFVYWIADAMSVALLPFVHPVFRDIPRGVHFLFDDTFWGRVCARFQTGLGGECIVLARRGNPERLRQIRRLMVHDGSFALAVDGGGPYRSLGSGIVSLANALGAAIVPIAVHASPALRIALRSEVRLPCPRSSVAVALGKSIRVPHEAARSQVTEQVRLELDELRSLVLAAPLRRARASYSGVRLRET